MKTAIDLLAAVAGGPATPEAERCARGLRAAGFATPEVANTIARAREPGATSSITWTVATFTGIVIASLTTARAIWVMNAAPAMTPLIPWWTPLLAAFPGLVILLTAAARARADAARAQRHAAARLGLELLGSGMPEELVVDIAAHLYSLDDDARRHLAQPPVSSSAATGRQRVALALAVHAADAPPERGRTASTVLGGLLVLALFATFFLVYFDLIVVDFAPTNLWTTEPPTSESRP